MGRKRKSRTIIKRIPVELLRKAEQFQREAAKFGRQITVQDALRRMAR